MFISIYLSGKQDHSESKRSSKYQSIYSRIGLAQSPLAIGFETLQNMVTKKLYQFIYNEKKYIIEYSFEKV